MTIEIESADFVALPLRKRIVFFGDSITENGTYIRNLEAFFLKHLPESRLEWINLGVSSETAAGTSEADHPFPRPCVHERLERALAEVRPDWAFICYGMNDGIYHPLGESRFEAYRDGVRRAVERVRGAGARVILMTPPPFDVASIGGEALPEGMDDYSFERPYVDYNSVLERYGAWVREYGEAEGLTVVDLREPLGHLIRARREADPDYRYGDGIHPNEDGHWVIARTILSRVFHLEMERIPDWAESGNREFIRLVGERRAVLNAAWREHVGHTNPNKMETPPLAEALQQAEALLPAIKRAALAEGGAESEEVREWMGDVRTDFYFGGRECVVVAPQEAAPGRPWVWRSEFFGAFADADLALLKQGWHIAYCRLSHLYGCPYAAGQMEAFRAEVAAKYTLALKPVLFGFSRGGLYALRYAALYPDRVAALYLDAPVVDIRSWPGGQGAGRGAPEEWRDCLAAYGIAQAASSPAEAARLAGEVTERLLAGLAAPARAGVPVLLVSGDADLDVPFEENGAVLKRAYQAHGGAVTTILKPGGGHHPHSLPDVTPIVEFVLAAAANHLR
ncbi:GDSL-type esterase/lipase family protein [Paenibacillus sp. MBLB2552]|uniref:GDSL-type esterase/lipase family protein n=1 Tax=Paenibacillus mellifer TaxID=2937794 RepID=A0A9X1Y1J1_9BACL|nr:alpha/beta fold hydrolase [Paenibacillus mellifer]MCK8485707.1 GDSL-type esterase/lipase family protein [Paenibacillus mellifer]